MLKSDVDSGRSSCSDRGQEQQIDLAYQHAQAQHFRNRCRLTREASTNTELRVSTRPRNTLDLLQRSPEYGDEFPSRRIFPSKTTVRQTQFDSPRKGGLSNAYSTLDIASSTLIDAPYIPPNAKSLNDVAVGSRIHVLKQPGEERQRINKVKPIQRVASRLYKADNTISGKHTSTCVGPEFIVLAAQQPVCINIATGLKEVEEKEIVIILLNGKRIIITCNPLTCTVGQIFEAVVKNQNYDQIFMLGISVLVGGDFVFLPDDFKVRKIAPEGWFIKNTHKPLKKQKPVPNNIQFTLFLRIKFFLPTNIARTVEGGPWKKRVYLQLRRSTVEGQLTASLHHLVQLSGYALHIEFGNYSAREHGSGDYFLMEHYLPEGSYIENTLDLKKLMKKAHEVHRGMDKDKATDCFIALAQTFKDYGSHFYSAVWATQDGFCRDVWLSITPRGIILYSRNTCISALPQEAYSANSINRVLLQSLLWHHIHTIYYNKKSLYIVPNNKAPGKTGLKYKLKMSDKKSYFTFWLSSLHHKFYLKLYAERDFLQFLTGDINIGQIKKNKLGVDNEENLKYEDSFCSNYQDSYNLAVRGQHKVKRQQRRKFKIDFFQDRKQEDRQNKENSNPRFNNVINEKEKFLTEIDVHDPNSNTIVHSSTDGLSSSESCSLPRRHGVKMGTRAFNGTQSKKQSNYIESRPCVRQSTFIDKQKLVTGNEHVIQSDIEMASTQSDPDDIQASELKSAECKINSMQLLPHRNYKCTDENTDYIPSAYVVESPKVYAESTFAYHPNDETCVNISLQEKFKTMGCVQGERYFVTALLQRDSLGTLGMQVAEGSDGNIYIKSITPNGPADKVKKFTPGDQIISVNGKTLLNMEYSKALEMLQSAPKNVELIVLQNVSENISNKSFSLNSRSILECNRSSYSIIDAISQENSLQSNFTELNNTENEMLNAEALKTIHALIKLTQRNGQTESGENTYLNTPNRNMMQKCLSENKIYDESDVNDCMIHDRSPYRKSSTVSIRTNKFKRRPLSLYISPDAKMSDDYFESNMNFQETHKPFMRNSMTELQNHEDVKKLSKTDLENAARGIAIPRNFGLSRKWIGPVKYPVTPSKKYLENVSSVNDVVRKHFIYGNNASDDEQVFL